MKKILSSPLFYPILLILICLLIAFKNYTPGTFLTGWDTLHPEFNFPLNFQRLFFGVWRDEQGLGAVSGHSAMADLPRVFILWLFHFILPLSFLRYSYIFLCLIVGPIGFYSLIKYLFKKPTLAFLGALIYLFNLGTLQQFYVPFEMFPTQWAYLPWIILYSLKYLQSPSTLRLLTFGLLTLLATPQAYAAHLWYPFFGIYILFLSTHTFLNKHKIKHSLILVLLTLLINSFWLLPNIYYALSQSENPRYNLSNRLHSQEFLLKNRQTGTIADTSLIKGFYFNWDKYNFDQRSSEPLMPQWKSHLQNYDIRLIGEIIFLSAFIGLIYAFISKNTVLIPFSPFFIIPFILLANNTPIFKNLFDLLLKINLLEEIFRFIFSKLSVLLTFGYSIFLTFFISTIFIIIPKVTKALSISIIIGLFIYCFPYFQGDLISSLVRTNIPPSYFEVQKYLQDKHSSRILTLPLHEPSGWTYYSWKYQGSGFVWFGLNQPVFDRDSDRWAYQNEEAYREFKYSLYSKDISQLTNTLKKYRVGYILWDSSVVSPQPKNNDQITFKNETNQLLSLLEESGYISLNKHFGTIKIFSVNTNTNLIELKRINNFIGPSYRWHYFDYQNKDDYLTTNTSKDSIFPFRSILDNLNKAKPEILSQLNINQQPETIFSGTKNFVSLNTTQGAGINLPNLSHNHWYIIGIKSKYDSGIPLRLCLKNQLTSLCTIEDEVTKNNQSDWDYFLVPPQDEFLGYTVELNLISYGSKQSSSTLETVTISQIDKSVIDARFEPTPSVNYPLKFNKIFPNNSLIRLKLNQLESNQTIILNQSFSPGWLAFYFEGLRPIFLKDHILVNNWANGWQLTSEKLTSEIYILFWPQLLQFLGFGLLISSFIFIFRKSETSHTTSPPSA